jgi:ribose transport system permease protein
MVKFVHTKSLSRIIRKVLTSISVPLGIFLLFQLICEWNGIIFINADNYRSFVVNTIYVALIGWGLYFHIPAGRFDFSIGSIIALAPLIGGNVALLLGLDAVGLLICCAFIGAVLGAMSGLSYVLLRLPAIVVSLGVALIYEAFTFILFDGKGAVLIGRSNMLYIIQQPHIYIMSAIVISILIIIINFTEFGFNLRALATGQHISVNTGINEKSNAVLCYVVCGALCGIAGALTLSRTGSASAALGLSTIMTMFLGFLPMFIGGILAKFSDPVIGIFLGAVATSLISSGFAALGMPLAAQFIFNAFILLGFLVFALNQNKFEEYFLIRKRKREAIEAALHQAAE